MTLGYARKLGLRLLRSLPLTHPHGLRLCRSTPVGSIPAGNGFYHSASPRRYRNMREPGLRLIDSNFPVLGLRPPLCCVYVAPLPAGSIRSLPLAHPDGLPLRCSIPNGSDRPGTLCSTFKCRRLADLFDQPNLDQPGSPPPGYRLPQYDQRFSRRESNRYSTG